VRISFKKKKTSSFLKRQKEAAKWRKCNLCAHEFQPRTLFERYCHVCREENELFKFGEWLPELDPVITERISA
jgi:hypothetical protein